MVVTPGVGDVTGIWRGGGQDAEKHPTMHRATSLLANSYPALNINYAKVEKPWLPLGHLKEYFFYSMVGNLKQYLILE